MSGKPVLFCALILVALSTPACLSSSARQPGTAAADQTIAPQAASGQTNPTPAAQNPTHQTTTRQPGPAATADPIVDSIRILCLYGSIPAKGWYGKEPMYGPNNFFNRLASDCGKKLPKNNFLPQHA